MKKLFAVLCMVVIVAALGIGTLIYFNLRLTSDMDALTNDLESARDALSAQEEQTGLLAARVEEADALREENARLQSDIDALRAEARQKAGDAAALENELARTQRGLESANKALADAQAASDANAAELAALEKAQAAQEETIAALNRQITEKDAAHLQTMAELNRELAEKAAALTQAQAAQSEQAQTIAELDRQVSEKAAALAQTQAENSAQAQAITALNQQLSEKEAALTASQAAGLNQAQTIAGLNRQLAEQGEALAAAQSAAGEAAALQAANEQQGLMIDTLNAALAEKESEVAALQAEAGSLNEALSALDRQAALLQAQLDLAAADPAGVPAAAVSPLMLNLGTANAPDCRQVATVRIPAGFTAVQSTLTVEGGFVRSGLVLTWESAPVTVFVLPLNVSAGEIAAGMHGLWSGQANQAGSQITPLAVLNAISGGQYFACRDSRADTMFCFIPTAQEGASLLLYLRADRKGGLYTVENMLALTAQVLSGVSLAEK